MFTIDSKHNYFIIEYNKAWRYTATQWWREVDATC